MLGWWTAQPDLERRLGLCVRQAFDEVYDGQRTGRYRYDDLTPEEKKFLGTKIEIIVQAEFGLGRGGRKGMDYVIDQHEVDCKWSISDKWMIPREAVGKLCLLFSAGESEKAFSVGLVRIRPDLLTPGENQDKKRTLTPAGVAAIRWVIRRGPLPENLLLHLPDAVRRQVFSHREGQKRVTELFRLVHNRIIRRQVVLTVGQQEDAMKRVRDARKPLAAEGIMVLGHLEKHRLLAAQYRVPRPTKGEFVAVKVADGPISPTY